ncbi:hypothetical protein [Methanoculleus taiwanensis]|uniref:hypothetical protein n=1 Tax=Methanoculleus taiwanensis TaxID=1550565 RepID=UPI0013E8A33D|nr:hypothetical protein [Methanoculleus taiwanensis]
MGRICSLFIVLECSESCGFSRIYNQPTEEQMREIDELQSCPRCGAAIRRVAF